MKTKTQAVHSIAKTWCIIATLVGLFTTGLQADAPQGQSPFTTILYFTRHGEDMPELKDPTYTVIPNLCNEDASCCVEALNPLGKMRADVLANWFFVNNITPTLTHVIATHKIRTRQTVAPIALAAGLGGDLNGDGIMDGTDVDQAPGDGVINVPPFPGECDPGWTSSKSVIQPQTEFIKGLPLGSRAVVCTHSPSMYPIMQALGIDTSDPVKFPKKPDGKVDGFNNLWAVELKQVLVNGTPTYQGRLLAHYQLGFYLGVTKVDLDYGAQPR